MTAAVMNAWAPIDPCGPPSEFGHVAACSPTGNFLGLTTELASVTGTNILAPLAKTPTGDLMLLIVNGQTFTPAEGSFSVAGNQVTWLSPIYSLLPGATVVAVYSYLFG